MTEQEIKDALVKFDAYLRANGVETRVGFWHGSNDEEEFGMTFGAPENRAFALASFVAEIQGYKLVRKT